ncbi:MAG TPA: hypothetical protein VFK39_14895 [Gemmatimonadaceae bacterium]|nr:hypothetical protein [Gemmatimonadaceae bacterium]
MTREDILHERDHEAVATRRALAEVSLLEAFEVKGRDFPGASASGIAELVGVCGPSADRGRQREREGPSLGVSRGARR